LGSQCKEKNINGRLYCFLYGYAGQELDKLQGYSTQLVLEPLISPYWGTAKALIYIKKIMKKSGRANAN
jgi:hypothetical protein